MTGTIDARLAELGITLPPAVAPVANYVAFAVTGNQVHVAGQLPMADGKVVQPGKLGREIDSPAGQAAARLCALNVLAQVKAACGNLDRVVRVVKLNGFVNGVPEFDKQPAVVNGASDLIVEVFGDAGKHARSAVGVASLPFDAPVEVDAIVEIR
jgi:enamine deaminase RidA (YjgF/YER057c/UK114 family)